MIFKMEAELPAKKEIIATRKEIEEEIKEMLVECESDFDLDYIKKMVYEEEKSDDMMKVVAAFDRGGDVSELENILDLATDAWNYFPHKSLNGKSPAEVVLKYQKKRKN